MNSYDEDPSVFNGHFEVEVLIHRAVADVWKQFIDVRSWVTSHDIEEVSEQRRVVGAVTRISPKNVEAADVPPPRYHYCKIVKMIPERQYVLKTYAEKGGSYGMQLTAFDDTRFIAMEGETKVVFNLFAEIRSEAVARDPAAMSLDGDREVMLGNLNNLKRIVEGG